MSKGFFTQTAAPNADIFASAPVLGDALLGGMEANEVDRSVFDRLLEGVSLFTDEPAVEASVDPYAAPVFDQVFNAADDVIGGVFEKLNGAGNIAEKTADVALGGVAVSAGVLAAATDAVSGWFDAPQQAQALDSGVSPDVIEAMHNRTVIADMTDGALNVSLVDVENAGPQLLDVASDFMQAKAEQAYAGLSFA